MWKVNVVITALACFGSTPEATVSTQYKMVTVDATSWANAELRANSIAHIAGQVFGQLWKIFFIALFFKTAPRAFIAQLYARPIQIAKLATMIHQHAMKQALLG